MTIMRRIGAMLGLAMAGAAPTLPTAQDVHKQRKQSMGTTFSTLYGGSVSTWRAPAGHAKGRTTAAAQRRAKIKRVNKRKHPRG